MKCTINHNLFNSLWDFAPDSSRKGKFYSLPVRENEGIGRISHMSIFIRLVLQDFTVVPLLCYLAIRGDEEFDIHGIGSLRPQQDVTLVIRRRDGNRQEVKLLAHINIAGKAEDHRHRGILPYVLREQIAGRQSCGRFIKYKYYDS